MAPLLFKKKVASLLGGNVKLIITGSAPLGPEMQKFVQTVFACPVRQGYGLTETMAGSCITATTDNATSVVGPPQECACIRLRDWEEGGYRAADLHNPEIARRRGEVLIGGPMVCAGYLTNPEMPDPEVEAKNKEELCVQRRCGRLPLAALAMITRSCLSVSTQAHLLALAACPNTLS